MPPSDVTPIRRVMVSADTSDAAPLRARWAASLAEFFNAELVGVAAHHPKMPAYAAYGDSLLSVSQSVQEDLAKQAVRSLNLAEAIFRRGSCKPAAAWRASTSLDPTPFLAEQCGDADIVVIGASGAGQSDPAMAVHPSDLLLSAGRPVVILPADIATFSPACIVVGWKDKPEARRAVSDAMPFLRAAKEVIVASASNEANPEETAGIRSYLELHGVGTVSHLTEPLHRRSPSDALLAVAQRVGGTMIVTGAYGQSRLKEWVLGGVTRDLLHRAPVPCLMSH